MPTLTSLTVNLKGDSSSLTKATRTAAQSIRNLSRGLGATVLKVGGLAAAITGLAGGAGLIALAKTSASSVDAIGKLSTQLGISGTDVQKLGLIAELSGIKTESLVKAMQRVTRLVGDAGAGSKEAGKLISRLGLSYDELNKASSVERFQLVGGALNKLGNATEKASLGNKLFEEQWQRLNPLLLGFSENAGRARAVFDTLGLGIGDGAKGVESLNDNLTVAGTMLVAFRDLVFSKAAPALNEIVVQVGRLAEAWIKANGGAGALADTLLQNVQRALQSVGGMFETLKNAAAPFLWVLDKISTLLNVIGHAQGGVVAAAGAVLDGNFAGAGRIISDLPGGLAAAAGFAQGGDDGAVDELKEQTDLLREVVRNGATGAFVF